MQQFVYYYYCVWCNVLVLLDVVGSPEDGHNDARNMLRQTLIIYI